MSGIVGIYRTDHAPVESALLNRMLRAIAHRGTDGGGAWINGSVGLGHRLLFTTPESLRESQPLVAPDKSHVLVWDGRLDNRNDLMATLRHAGIPLGDRTDPDLVLSAYRYWGTQSPQHLAGDYAFAIWNAQNRSLFCARDRMGLKPFHYWWDETSFAFGSEIRPLIVARGSAPDPDDEMVLAFLLREFREADADRTFYKEIRRLPPGHALEVKSGSLRVWPYWEIDPARETRYADDRQYAEQFRSLFEDAVAARLRSYFPVGVLLSGGLDSSAILCASHAVIENSEDGFPAMEAFSLFSSDPASDERGYVNDAIEATGIKSHFLGASDDHDPLRTLDSLVNTVESPVIGPGYGDGEALRSLLKGRGCRVLLTGEGGDQLLDEIGYLADLLARGCPWRFFRETNEMARWHGEAVGGFLSVLASMLLPSTSRFWAKRMVRGLPPPWMNAAMAKKARLRERVRSPRLTTRFRSYSQADTYLQVCGPFYGLKLEADERLMSALGLELRYPFLDSRLVEFILSIPSEHRTRNGMRKWVLREALSGILPERIRLRAGKGDWTDSTDRILTHLCRRNAAAPIENRSGKLDRYLDLDGTRALMNRYLRGQGALRWDLWYLIALDRWLAQCSQGGSNAEKTSIN